MKTLIQNEEIQIIYTEKQDISFVVKAEQENSEYVGQWSISQHENALNDPDILHLIIKDINFQNIGYIIIRGLTNINDSIELMRIVITNKNSGYGNKVISLLKKWCFEIKQAHRFWLDVREENLRAQHVYKKQGFKQEGILRECIKSGNNYQSLVVMSILSNEYIK